FPSPKNPASGKKVFNASPNRSPNGMQGRVQRRRDWFPNSPLPLRERGTDRLETLQPLKLRRVDPKKILGVELQTRIVADRGGHEFVAVAFPDFLFDVQIGEWKGVERSLRFARSPIDEPQSSATRRLDI